MSRLLFSSLLFSSLLFSSLLLLSQPSQAATQRTEYKGPSGNAPLRIMSYYGTKLFPNGIPQKSGTATILRDYALYYLDSGYKDWLVFYTEMTRSDQGGDGFSLAEYMRIAQLAGITNITSLDRLTLHFNFFNASKPSGETHNHNIDRNEFTKLIGYIEEFLGQDVFKTLGFCSTCGQGAMDFVSFEHTSGGFESTVNPNYAKAAEFKKYVMDMWYNDPDFRDLMENVRLLRGRFTMELANLGLAKGGESYQNGRYAAINERTYNIRKNGSGLISIRSTIVHEIFHILGLGHRRSENVQAVVDQVPGVNTFEAASIVNNQFFQAFNNNDNGLTKESYNFRNPNYVDRLIIEDNSISGGS